MYMSVCECIPSLVKVDKKHHIISETGQSVRGWHGDDEGKHIVDEGIECLATINRCYSVVAKKQTTHTKDSAGYSVNIMNLQYISSLNLNTIGLQEMCPYLIHEGLPGEVGHRFQLLSKICY